jgi:hypothetical protein
MPRGRMRRFAAVLNFSRAPAESPHILGGGNCETEISSVGKRAMTTAGVESAIAWCQAVAHLGRDSNWPPPPPSPHCERQQRDDRKQPHGQGGDVGPVQPSTLLAFVLVGFDFRWMAAANR